MKIVVWEQTEEATGARAFVASHTEKAVVAGGASAKSAAGQLIAWLLRSQSGEVPPLDFAERFAPIDPDYPTELVRVKNAQEHAVMAADPAAYLRSTDLGAQYDRDGITDEEIRSRAFIPTARPHYPDAADRVGAMFRGGEILAHPKLPPGWELRIWRGDDSTLPPWPASMIVAGGGSAESEV